MKRQEAWVTREDLLQQRRLEGEGVGVELSLGAAATGTQPWRESQVRKG